MQMIDLKERHEFSGLWWKPDDIESKTGGSLILTHDRIVLTGVGTDTPLGLSDVIHGRVFGVGPITLFGCNGFRHPFRGEMRSFRIIADRAVFGFHFDTLDDERYSAMKVVFDGISIWCSTTGFNFRFWEKQSEENIRSGATETGLALPRSDEKPLVEVAYFRPDNVELGGDDSVRVILEHRLSAPLDTSRDREVRMSEKHILTLRSKEPQSFSFFERNLRKIQNFLTVAMAYPTFPRQVELLGSHDKLHVFMPLFRFPVQSPPSLEHDLLFTMYEMVVQAPSALSTWLSQYERFEAVLEHFFATLHQPEMFLHNRFLQLLQSLESYHRLTETEDPDKAEETENRRQQILEACPAEHREWLTQKLSYATEQSLLTRLKDLMNRYSYAFPMTDSTSDSYDHVIMTMRDTRNFFTHLAGKGKKRVLATEELPPYCHLAVYWLFHCMLTLMGWDQDQIKQISNRSETLETYREIIKRIEPVNRQK